jgi:hypothetical protein
MKYHGSCHCGRVAFEVEGEIGAVIECNCSICSKKGSLLWFVPREAVRFTTPESEANEYLFNKHAIHHRFCPTCGIHPYAVGKEPKQGREMAAINVRCLEGVDPSKLEVKAFDGRSL